MWDIPRLSSADNSTFIVECKQDETGSDPYTPWNTQCEGLAMQTADVNVSLPTRAQNREENEERQEADIDSDDHKQQAADTDSESAKWGETTRLRNEDTDVRYDSVWRREDLCWLCLRPFSDSSDEDQTFDMIGRACTGPWIVCDAYHHGEQPACECKLCVDCWRQACDNRCPVCHANIFRFRLLDRVGFSGYKWSRGIRFLKRSRRRQMLKRRRL